MSSPAVVTHRKAAEHNSSFSQWPIKTEVYIGLAGLACTSDDRIRHFNNQRATGRQAVRDFERSASWVGLSWQPQGPFLQAKPMPLYRFKILGDLAPSHPVSRDKHNCIPYRCLSDVFSKLSPPRPVRVHLGTKCSSWQLKWNWKGFKTNRWILHWPVSVIFARNKALYISDPVPCFWPHWITTCWSQAISSIIQDRSKFQPAFQARRSSFSLVSSRHFGSMLCSLIQPFVISTRRRQDKHPENPICTAQPFWQQPAVWQCTGYVLCKTFTLDFYFYFYQHRLRIKMLYFGQWSCAQS